MSKCNLFILLNRNVKDLFIKIKMIKIVTKLIKHYENRKHSKYSIDSIIICIYII
jgi:hypothetical protein